MELRLKKVLYKVSLHEDCHRISWRAFIGLTIHPNFFVGGRPLLRVIGRQSDRVISKLQILHLFSFVATQRYDLREKVQLTVIGSK